MKKILIAVLILIGLASAGVVYSQNGWIGTAHISSGELIRSAPLLSNISFLFENKVHKPDLCNGSDVKLGWINGVWSCDAVAAPEIPAGSSCILDGQTISDGSSITAYQTQTVPFGQQCISESRTCTNGVLSGSYGFTTCGEVEPGSCTFNGQEVRHGESVTAYESGSVNSPATCTSETRTCTNGVLSGSYSAATCSVQAGACTSQDLVFSYTVAVGERNGAQLQRGTTCRVSSGLVPNAQVGESETYTYPNECQPNGSSVNESDSIYDYQHTATCGFSGWELSTQQVNSTQTCSDAGTVVETKPFASAATEIQVDDRCDCGVSAHGGPYGRSVTCLDRSEGSPARN